MLSKRFRLPVQQAFKRRGSMLRVEAFTLRVLAPERTASRFGIAVSRAAAPSAVKRNRLKRIFFNTVKTVANTLPCRDYLVIAHPQAGALTKDQTKQELTRLFQKNL